MGDPEGGPESTCARVGKLYAYFLEVSHYFMDYLVHGDMCVPKIGETMLEVLVKRLAKGNWQKYIRLIQEEISLSSFQKKLLTPASGIIDIEELDFSIYVKIFTYLGGDIKRNDIKYMCSLRNELCHHPFQRYMSQEEFWELCDNMTSEFKALGFSDAFLEWCKASISIDNQIPI